MPEKRSPAIVDRAAREKIKIERAGIRWGNVVEKIWKDLGDQAEVLLSIEKFAGTRQK